MQAGMAVAPPGGVCQEGQQHRGEQEVAQVIGPELHLKAIFRPELRARHDPCKAECRTAASYNPR